nr:uncharacterized protein LOC129269798 [Lytechinus pictus]
MVLSDTATQLPSCSAIAPVCSKTVDGTGWLRLDSSLYKGHCWSVSLYKCSKCNCRNKLCATHHTVRTRNQGRGVHMLPQFRQRGMSWPQVLCREVSWMSSPFTKTVVVPLAFGKATNIAKMIRDSSLSDNCGRCVSPSGI